MKDKTGECSSSMPSNEASEYLKTFDFASLILDQEGAAEYPKKFAYDAYYGFYLLGKCAGSLLRAAFGTNPAEESERLKVHAELALYYLETGSPEEENAFQSTRPLTYILVEGLLEFVGGCSEDWDREQSLLFYQHVNQLVEKIEKSRKAGSILRSTDIYLARQWCRLFRAFGFLRIPPEYLPPEYSYERDLSICKRRGIQKEPMEMIRFRFRFIRLLEEQRIGKLILLAEEWERFASKSKTEYDRFEYEIQVLTFLDSDLHYAIGLEWVQLLEHRHPEVISFRKWHVRYLRRSGELRQALLIIQLLISEKTEDYEAYCLASNLSFMLEEYETAERYGVIAVNLCDTDPSCHLSLAYPLLYEGKYEQCLRQFKQAILLDDTIADAYRGLAKAQMMLGFAFDAMKSLRKAARLLVDDAELFHDLADVYFMCGYLDECRTNCEKCLSLDPENAGAYVLLGMLEIRIHREARAGKWLHKALEIEPTNPIALNELAYIQHLSGNDEEALRLLEKAQKIAPDFPDVTCSLGIVYFYRSEFDTALDYFDQTLELDPEHSGALVGKGNLYLAKSECEDAIHWFDLALAVEPDDEEAIHGKVSAFRSMGLEQEAFELLQKANEMGFDTDYD